MMKIKRIEMHNIRSYINEAIEIPDGTMLLEGDIGSGKSTILMAIEFALFGGGDIDYSSLLRIGEDSGYVELAIEVDGKDYTLYRELKRNAKSGKIEHKTCHISSTAGRTPYSATEMKTAVLKLLKFREPKNARASSVVYRYSVYTPQEEMRIILENKPDERLNTMRKIFNLEKYSTAADNARTAAKNLGTKKEVQQDKLKEEPDIIKKKEEDEENLNLYRMKLKDNEAKKEKLESDISDTDKEYENAKKKYDDLKMKNNDLKTHQKLLLDKMKEKDDKVKSIERRINTVKELQKQTQDIIIPEVIENVDELNSKIDDIIKEIGNIEHMKGEKTGIIKKYEDMTANGICPLCGREVYQGEFEPKLKDLKKEYEEINTKASKLQDELKELKQRRDHATKTREMARQREDLLNKAKHEEEYIAEAHKDLATINKYIQEENEIINRLSGEVGGLESADKKLRDIERKKRELNDMKMKLEGEVRDAKAHIDETERRLEEYGRKFEEFGKARQKVERYSNLISFLQDVFIPALAEAEQSIMVSLNREMNELVSSWFAKLVPDPMKEITIDDNFTPIIRQSGYDMDVSSLSGGEKSAVALSYRLALNAIVNNYVGNVGVLILDEPTDGFSKEQLQKFGDVLRDINSEQIILVSHEAELENVADRVMRVEKSEGVSHID